MSEFFNFILVDYYNNNYIDSSNLDTNYLNNVQENISNAQFNTSNIFNLNIFDTPVMEEGSFVKQHVNESQYKPGLNEEEKSEQKKLREESKVFMRIINAKNKSTSQSWEVDFFLCL